MAPSEMARSGIDQIVLSPRRCPVVARACRHEADRPLDSSRDAIHDGRDHRIRIENLHPFGVCCPSVDGHHGLIADRVADRPNDVQNEDSWGFEALFRRLFGAVQLIQKLRQAIWIVQKQPANHCLKSSGLSICRGITAAWATTGTVASTPNQGLFLVIEPGLEPFQRNGLCIGSHFSHDSAMQILGTSWLSTVTQALMQLPDRVPQPGELEWSQIRGPC